MARQSGYALFLVTSVLTLAVPLFGSDDPAVFKSEVAMTRIDAQVVDHTGRAIGGLEARDFVLRLDGHVVPIRKVASENMPIDILLLLDVSGSMRPHVERIAAAAEQALNVLADKDRIAIMVFDTSTRVRLPFRSSHSEVTGELKQLLRSETFNGGTRITHALLDAAAYVDRQARRDARRAVVILTDDQTQDEEEEARVDAAMARANSVLSFLQATYEEPGMRGGGHPRGTWGSGGSWPGGGGIGFPGGGPVVLGRGGPGGTGGVDRSHTAGTADIARDSGGDTMPVGEASALEDTLARLRQRYALYFYVPQGAAAVNGGSLRLDLSQQTRVQFQEAELHYRRVYMSGSGSGERTGPVISRVQEPAETIPDHASTPADDGTPKGRRVAVNEESGPTVNTIDTDPPSDGQPSPSSGEATVPPRPDPAHPGGWPRANDSQHP